MERNLLITGGIYNYGPSCGLYTYYNAVEHYDRSKCSLHYYYHWRIDPSVDTIDYTIYGTVIGVYATSNSSNSRAGLFMQQPIGTYPFSSGYGSLNYLSIIMLDLLESI